MPNDVPEEGEPIPSVDPEELRRRWNIKPPWNSEALQEAATHEVDSSAVSSRDRMLRMLANFSDGQLLAPWRRGEDLHDAVFRIAATFPMRAVRQRVYQIAGDDIFGFDPNAFVQRLVEETGIPHVWEPIPDRIEEGGWSFTFVRATFKTQASPEAQGFPDEREVRRHVREVLWDAWSKYFHLQPSPRGDKETNAKIMGILFADFVIDNFDLARQLMSLFGSGDERAAPFVILTELERRAKGWRP